MIDVLFGYESIVLAYITELATHTHTNENGFRVRLLYVFLYRQADNVVWAFLGAITARNRSAAGVWQTQHLIVTAKTFIVYF